MRYILDVSGRDLELIKASIANFQRSLEMSSQADFSHIIDELDDTYLSIKIQATIYMAYDYLLSLQAYLDEVKTN